MVSPLLRRKWALEAAKKAASENTANITESLDTAVEHESQLISVEQKIAHDIAVIESIKSVTEKNEFKRTAINNYLPYIRDESISWDYRSFLILWLWDVGMVADALPVSIEAARADWAVPRVIKKRSWTELVADFVLSWAEEQYENNLTLEPYFSGAFNLINEMDTYDAIKAKYHKLAGLAILGDKDAKIKDCADSEKLQSIVYHFEEATSLYDRIGLKTRIKEAKSQIEKLAAD